MPDRAAVRLPVDRQPPPGTLMMQWVVYDHPSDYPDGYMLRAAYVMKDITVVTDSVAWYAESLDALRAMVPAGLVRRVCLAVCVYDRFLADPSILEIWL